jgi:hypothetical protein
MTTALLLAALLHSQASQVPPCPVADNETYAYTKEQPVQVGGAQLYGAARQRRYLDTLRGPEGQAIKYRRLGSMPVETNGTTFLDIYEVTYEGLAKPITLYLDFYHYNPLRAPRGLTCATPFNLGAPPLDNFREYDQTREVAVEQGAARDFPPIPLATDAEPHGAIYDTFRLLALASRAATASGKPLDPKKAGDIGPLGMTIVAYPLPCEGQKLSPTAIALHAANGAAVPRKVEGNLPAATVATMLPGVKLPDGAIVVTYPLSRPRPNDTVVVTYSGDGCGVTANARRFPLQMTAARGVEMPSATPPAGVTVNAPMLLQGLIDLDGKIQRPEYIGGQQELLAIAKENLAAWKVEPARVNGAPIATGVVAQVQFK